ncbi:MAG: glycine oxidase ThiO [Burkholderiaceae bacterium]|nr:MAG: glycine oxidase ThiO [Burkholderiaceae bacterium]TBR74993.1 MAG: glycine oxidase ThiO [Burkholderiaceae bacterium]
MNFRAPSTTPASVVLGAGLMGRLLAVQLAHAGHRVELFDAAGPQAEGAAARVAAAMLAPLAESAVTEASVVQMGLHAMARWPALISKLDEPVFFQQQGSLVLWHRQDTAEAARFTHQLGAMRGSVPQLPAPQALDAAGVARLEPSLAARFAQGLYLPGEGQLDNRQLLAALLQHLEKLQARLHWHSPRDPRDFTPGQPGQPDWVFDCRGLGARGQWPDVRGVRGEIIRVHAPEVALTRPTRLIHPRYPLYIVPKQDHLFVIGATEIESDDLSPPSVRSTLELLSAAYTVHSGFAEARILEIATQCRPALPDNLPAIRQLGPRVLQINGLFRHGFMIAPALLDVVMEWVGHGESGLAASFGLDIEPACGAVS